MALKNIKKRELKPPVIQAPSLPAAISASPDGAIMVSAGKHARNIVLTAFEHIGGLSRLVEEADADPKWFYDKLFSKTIAKEVEIDKKDDVEDLIDALDAEFEEVTDVESESV